MPQNQKFKIKVRSNSALSEAEKRRSLFSAWDLLLAQNWPKEKDQNEKSIKREN